MRYAYAAVAAYVLIGFLTFGYSWNAEHRRGCRFEGDCIVANIIESGIRGFAWPLYWSVQAFKGVRK